MLITDWWSWLSKWVVTFRGTLSMCLVGEYSCNLACTCKRVDETVCSLGSVEVDMAVYRGFRVRGEPVRMSMTADHVINRIASAIACNNVKLNTCRVADSVTFSPLPLAIRPDLDNGMELANDESTDRS